MTAPVPPRRANSPGSGLRILVRSYDDKDARALVEALYREQVALYGYADPIDLAPGEPPCAPPEGEFLVGYIDHKPVACGGYRIAAADEGSRVVEIKKMYTVPEWRGRGVGQAILAKLEFRAVAQGADQVVVETGVYNAAALALYAKQGYRAIEGYVAGRNPAINRAFRKRLAAPVRVR